MTKRIGIPQLTKPTEAIKPTELADLCELNQSNWLNWQIPTGGGYGSLAAAQARNLLGSETSHSDSGMLPGAKGDKDEYTLRLGLCDWVLCDKHW